MDSIISLKGDAIIYLRAGTEFDIKKDRVSYVEHSTLGRIDMAEDMKVNKAATLTIPEPDFNGDAYICDFENKRYFKMEKVIGQIKTKEQFWGPEEKLYVKSSKSPVRVRIGKIKVILRVPNINDDPYSFIKVSRFSTSITRKLTLSRQNELTGKITYGGNNNQEKSFDIEKYGQSSFLLTLDMDQTGEYCISISNPNKIDGKLSLSCFGVDE